jgi:hypothetical protein
MSTNAWRTWKYTWMFSGSQKLVKAIAGRG